MAGNNTPRGFTSLAEQRRSARRRLLIAAVVGVLCFGGGIGIVAALKAPLDTGDGDAASPVAANDSPLPPEDEEPTPTSTHTPPDPTPAPPPDDPPTPPDPAPAAEPPAPAKDEPDAAEAPPDPAPPSRPAQEGRWWERTRGRRCRIDFRGKDRLIMREGELRKDETTTYGPFVDNPIALRIRANLDPIVTPQAFGIHPRTRVPCVVYGTVEQGDQKVQGVLPLLIGEDQLELVPLDAAER